VTSSLQAWVGGTANNGWRITDEDEGTAQHVEYVTREDPVSGLRPTLNVTYAP
jgi:hypothetical protein